jgi:hypothetical protein
MGFSTSLILDEIRSAVDGKQAAVSRPCGMLRVFDS